MWVITLSCGFTPKKMQRSGPLPGEDLRPVERGQQKSPSCLYDELGAGRYPGLPQERHIGLGRRAIALALIARGVRGDRVEPLRPAASRSRLHVVHRVGVVQPAVRTAKPVPPQHTVL